MKTLQISQEIRGVFEEKVERETGLEPATFSLGS